MKKFTLFIAALLMAGSMMATTVWTAVSSIKAGDVLVLGSPDALIELKAISTTSTKYGLGQAFTTAPAGVMPLTVVTGNKEGTFAFKTSDNKYLTWTSGNSLNVNATLSDNTSWTVTFDGVKAAIVNAADNARQIWWNVQYTRFASYTGKSHGTDFNCPSLYKEIDEDALAAPTITGNMYFIGSQTITLTADAGVDIYYRLDGGDPTPYFAEEALVNGDQVFLYSGPFEINESCDLKAIACKNYTELSEISSKSFTMLETKTCFESRMSEKNDIVALGEVVVTYVNGSNTYVKDATGSALIYGSLEGLQAGDVINGFIGKSAPYNGLPELVPLVEVADLEIVHGEAPAPVEYNTTITDEELNKYMLIKDVAIEGTFTENNRDSLNGAYGLGVNEIFCNYYKNLSYTFEAGNTYDIVCIGFCKEVDNVKYYQFNVISATVNGGGGTGIEDAAMEGKAVKVLRDGQIIILRGKKAYNLVGAEL